MMSVRRNSFEMSGATSIATSLIVRVAVVRIVRTAKFVRDELSSDVGTVQPGEQSQERIGERYQGVHGWQVLL